MDIVVNYTKISIPTEYIWLSLGAPLIYLWLLIFTKSPKSYLFGVFYILLTDYIFLLLGLTILFRVSKESASIQTELLWGYDKPSVIIQKDNILNILGFLPIGMLSSIISKKYVVIKSFFVGLLLSETIECSQLIFRRGTFDVNDLINNVIGAIIGAFIYIVLRLIFNKFKDRKIEMDERGTIP